MGNKLSSTDFLKLKEKAYLMMSNAYAPYSKFSVGAALLANDKKIFGGCNVENAAYPEGLCAEAGAISAMIAGGASIIEAICVISKSKKIVSPCGGCRQKIREFSTEDTEIYLLNVKGEVKVFLIEDLLPFSFSEFDNISNH